MTSRLVLAAAAVVLIIGVVMVMFVAGSNETGIQAPTQIDQFSSTS